MSTAPDVDTNHFEEPPAIFQRADATLLAETALNLSPFEVPAWPQDPERQAPNDQPAIVTATTAGTRKRALHLVEGRRAHTPRPRAATPQVSRDPSQRAEVSSSQVTTRNRKPIFTRSGSVHFQ